MLYILRQFHEGRHSSSVILSFSSDVIFQGAGGIQVPPACSSHSFICFVGVFLSRQQFSLPHKQEMEL